MNTSEQAQPEFLVAMADAVRGLPGVHIHEFNLETIRRVCANNTTAGVDGSLRHKTEVGRMFGVVACALHHVALLLRTGSLQRIADEADDLGIACGDGILEPTCTMLVASNLYRVALEHKLGSSEYLLQRTGAIVQATRALMFFSATLSQGLRGDHALALYMSVFALATTHSFPIISGKEDPASWLLADLRRVVDTGRKLSVLPRAQEKTDGAR